MPITDDEATAVQELHLMNSSKLFVLTTNKFWKSVGMPQNIQTDGLVRGLYCLDYPHSDHGVVLVSYTWGDDSTKYIAIKDPHGTTRSPAEVAVALSGNWRRSSRN